MKRVARLVAVGLVLVVAAAFAIGRPVAWVEAALIMWDIAAAGKGTLWQDVTPPPRQSTVHWPGGEGDLYLPAGQVRAAMVLVPGAAALGRDEPRMQALARSFARAGFAVLVPELPEVRRLALSRRDADRVAEAMRYLDRTRSGVPLGVAAISYAVAPAVIAALQDDLAGRVAFVVGIGGYRDSEAVIRFLTTGVFRPRGDSREFRVEPNNYGRWVFVLANAGRLDSLSDARLLEEIARLRFVDREADIARLAAGLGPQGRAVLALMENRDPDAVGRLIAALPGGIRREIDGLNLALHDLSKLRGHLILVHGRGDPMVPYSESQDLAAAASGADVSLFLVDDIGHVEFTAVNIRNAWTVWQAVSALLAERR
ncbi:MAG: alpha/beta hydrolase [Alphaproteobacteria bacterium]|nr:alpha/beta hydrolase [Alphaproteobacteria bacterium]